MRIEKGQTGALTSLGTSLCNPRQAQPGCFVLQTARPYCCGAGAGAGVGVGACWAFCC
jgi:hypothetical protein